MESLLTAPLVEKLLKDEIDVLISVDPMFNDDRWVRREIYRESFLVLSKDKIENPCTFEDLQRLSIYPALYLLRCRKPGQDRLRSIFERLECSTARNRDSFIELRNYRFGPRTQRLGASDADKRLERKTFFG